MSEQAVVWMWRHYHLNAEVFDSLDEAMESAYLTQEMGEGSLSSIETADGVIPDHQYEAYSRRRDEEDMEKYRAQPKMTHKVVVRDPSAKDDAWLDSYADEASAHAAFDALPEWLRTSGRARVTTVP